MFSFDFEPKTRTIKPVSFWERSPKQPSLIAALLKAPRARKYLANGVQGLNGEPRSRTAKIIQSVEGFNHKIRPVGELDVAAGFVALDYLLGKGQIITEEFSGWQKLDAQLSRNTEEPLTPKCCAFLQGILWIGFSEASLSPIGWATLETITGPSLVELLRI